MTVLDSEAGTTGDPAERNPKHLQHRGPGCNMEQLLAGANSRRPRFALSFNGPGGVEVPPHWCNAEAVLDYRLGLLISSLEPSGAFEWWLSWSLSEPTPAQGSHY